MGHFSKILWSSLEHDEEHQHDVACMKRHVVTRVIFNHTLWIVISNPMAVVEAGFRAKMRLSVIS